jgi:hypothetical protein
VTDALVVDPDDGEESGPTPVSPSAGTNEVPPPVEKVIAPAAPETTAPGVTAAAVTPTPVSGISAIESVLSSYVKAFNMLDVRAAKAVWPAVDERALGRAFEGLQQQEFQLEPCQIDIKSVVAVARCQAVARYVPRVGTRNIRSERRRWTFYLGQHDKAWSIHSVETR